jgi:hypothetical protein
VKNRVIHAQLFNDYLRIQSKSMKINDFVAALDESFWVLEMHYFIAVDKHPKNDCVFVRVSAEV